MAFDENGRIYIKLDQRGKPNHFDKAWDDGAEGSIKQILLWFDEDYISGIQIAYERNGTKLISKRHGGTQGKFKMINPKRPLTWLSGYYGIYYDPSSYLENGPCSYLEYDPCSYLENDPSSYYRVITSLKFGNKEETYGPFGFEGGPFDVHFSFCPGAEIEGLHGSSYDPPTVGFGYISAIGIYVKTAAVGHLGVTSASSIESEVTQDGKCEMGGADTLMQPCTASLPLKST